MANELFRSRLVTAIKNAVLEAENARAHDHMGERGLVRQIVLERLIRPLLPISFDLGIGTIVDGAGGKSAQTDIVVYSTELLPRILYSERDGVFPVEATAFAIEVKSRLTAAEVKDAVQKARRIERLLYSSGYHDDRGNPQIHYIRKIQPLLFAFSSDLASGGKSELERYIEIDSNPDAAIPNICVVGRGFWWQDDVDTWCYQPASDDYDEVLFALAIIINSLTKIISSRGQPRFGWYILPYGSRRDMIVDM